MRQEAGVERMGKGESEKDALCGSWKGGGWRLRRKRKVNGNKLEMQGENCRRLVKERRKREKYWWVISEKEPTQVLAGGENRK